MEKISIGKIILNRYRVEEFIDSGGTKVIYKVQDQIMGVPLAMKVPRGDLEDDKDTLKTLKREANALASLQHPNIVQFFGMQRLGSSFIMFENFIDGPSLKDILKEQNKLSLEEALIYFKALSGALGFAHAKGIVHCDVKPGNVLTDQGGKILLTDFGIARHSGSDVTSILKGAGTTPYMAPEQILAHEVTAETDIYALGVTLFEMLTGKLPFSGNERDSTTHGTNKKERTEYEILNIDPPDLHKINRDFSEELGEAVVKALAKDPAERYHTTQQFLSSVCLAVGTNENNIPDRIQASIATPPPSSDISKTPVRYPDWTSPRLDRIKEQKPVILAAGSIALLFIIYALIPKSVTLSPPSAETAQIVTTTAITPAFTIVPTTTQTATVTPVPVPEINWLTEEIDIKEGVGVFSNLAMDNAGTQYVVYLDDKNDDLKMASYDRTSWVTKTIVKNTTRDGWYPSMVFDQQNTMHIAYYAYDKHQIMYGNLMKSGFWNIIPAIRNVVVQDISLVIGTDNVPQLIYFDKDNQEIRYTRKNDSGWSTPVTVASGNAEGIYFPAVTDTKNQLHLVYLSDSGGLWYVKYENNKWTAPEPIDQNDGAGYYPSIVVDGNSQPHVSYYNRSTGDLMYAFREGNKWELICVDSTNDTGQYTSIGIDKKDNLHISYYDIDQQVLKYAFSHTKPWLPNAWYTYVVDNRAGVGTWNSLLLNQDGNPQISYYNATNETLMYAYADIQDILKQ